MKRILLLFLIISITGCASTSQGSFIRKPSKSSYIDIDSFCQENNFQYSYDTIDDIVTMHSPEKEIKLLLNSPVVSIAGSILNFKNAPLYYQGNIFIPRQIENVINSREFVVFKPLFAIKTVVIDPGHGGKDPGAVSPRGLKEKIINLQISKYLKQELQKQGFKVFLTRDKDNYLSLRQRVDFARKNNADLFISIHTNSSHSQKLSGAEIYYLLPSRINSRERSIRLARSEKFQGKDIGFDVEAMLWDLIITKNYSFSVELSDALYFAFKDFGFKVRSPKKAPFYVLRYAYVPSVLVETGYLSNYYEEKALRGKHYQKQIAQAVTAGVMKLKKRYATVGRTKRTDLN